MAGREACKRAVGLDGARGNFLLKGVSLAVTQDSERRLLRSCDVRVSRGLFWEIGFGLKRDRGEEQIDCKGRLMMPGLINTHNHLPMSVLRGLGDDLPLHEWLTTRIFPLEEKMGKAEYVSGAEFSLMEAALTGTTTVLDMYMQTELYYESLEKSGMRVFSGYSITDFGDPSEKIRRAEKMLKKGKAGSLVRPGIAPHAIYTTGNETIKACFSLAEKYDTFFQIHASETRKEVSDSELSRGKRPIEVLDSLGVLSPRTTLAHCGWISKSEARTIARTGAGVSHCPVSNMKLATGGVSPIPELDSYGAKISLGTDGPASNNTLDMFDTMKFSALIHKHHRWDATTVSAQKALDYATIGGARALGIEKETGSIEIGKDADFLLLDLSNFRLKPLANPASLIVYSATGDVPKDVYVRGRKIVSGSRHIAFDSEKSAKALESATERICRKAGIPVPEFLGADKGK